MDPLKGVPLEKDWDSKKTCAWLVANVPNFKAEARFLAEGVAAEHILSATTLEELAHKLRVIFGLNGAEIAPVLTHIYHPKAVSGLPPALPSDAMIKLQEDFNRYKIASEAKQQETEAKLAEVETQLRVMSVWSTSKPYANIYAEWQRACPNLLSLKEFLEKTGVQMSADSLTQEAWKTCKPDLPSLEAQEKHYQALLENVLNGLLKYRAWSDLKPFFKHPLGDDERRIPDAFFLIRPSGETPSWLTVCLPLELENGEEGNKNEGRGQACAYLSQMAKQRIAARQAEYIRGISIFTNLRVISFMFTERNPTDGVITRLMSAEFPLFAYPTVSPGFQALLSLLMAPLHLLVAPLTKPPMEGVTSLVYAANGTEIWRHPTEDAIIKVATTREKREQLAHEVHVLSLLPGLGWKVTNSLPSMITISPRGHRSLKGHICGAVEAANYMRQLVAQVKIAHLAGFVHCDVRPSNVIMFDAKIVRLGDWGSSGKLTDGIYTANPIGVICWLSDGAAANAKRSAPYDYRIHDDLESLAYIYCFMLGTHTEPPWQHASVDAMLQARRKSMSWPHLASTKFLEIVRARPNAVHDELLTFLSHQ